MKRLLSLWALLALLLPLATQAQQTLTVANGTTTNEYVPVYGYYLDDFCRAQFIYPASMLGSMSGSTITDLTFYVSQAPEDAWSSTIAVKFSEVTDSVFGSSAFFNTASEADAYIGTLTVSAGTMAIALDEPYTYSGGNLLVEFYSVTDGNYSRAYFYGINRSNASVSGYNSSGISSISSPTRRSFLPKVTFTYTAGTLDMCYRPKALAASDTTTSGFTLSWIDTSNTSASYNFRMIHGIDTTYEYNVSSPYSVSSLEPNTVYNVSIQANCGSTQSGWTSISVRTACGNITLPFSEGFEGMPTGTGNTPVCWTTLETSTSSSSRLYVSTSSRHSGTAAAYLYPYGEQYLISGALPEQANNLTVSFWASVSSSMTSFEAGLMTNPADSTTFVPFFTLNGGNSSTWQEYEFRTDTTTLTGTVYLAFRARAANGWSAYIDDISVTAGTSCYRPDNLLVNGITYDNATLAWTDTTGSSSYDIAFGTNPDPGMATVASNITDNPYTLTGLQPGTTYYAWIRSNCGSEQTGWRQFPAFTTDLTCYPVGNAVINSVSYTSASFSWEYANAGRGYEPTGAIVSWLDQSDSSATLQSEEVTGTSYFLTGLTSGHTYTVYIRTICDPDTSTALTGTFTTTVCGEVSSDAGASGTSTSTYYPVAGYYNHSYSQMLYSRSAITGMDTIYGISFQVSSGSGTVSGINVYMGVTAKTGFTGTTDYIPATQLTQVASGKNIASTGAGWYTITFDTPYEVPANGDNLVVTLHRNSTYTTSYPTFAQHSTSGYKTLYAYRDSPVLTLADPMAGNPNRPASRPNIRFVGTCNVECIGANLLAAGSDVSSVDLEWVAGLDETSWILQYRAAADTVWTDGGTVTASPYTVSSLNARTLYGFRLGTVCASGDTVWSNTASIYTACADMVLPYFESFEGMPTGSNSTGVLCWNTVINGSGSAYASNSTPHDGSSSLYLYPSTATSTVYAITPAIPAAANELEISFWATFSSGDLTVGLVSSPDSLNSFVPLKTISGGNGNTYTEYIIYADTVTFTGTPYLAFRKTGSSSVYIDEVGIAINNGCERATDPVVTALSATSASIAWTGDLSGSFEVRYATTNNTEDPDAVTVTVSGDTNATLTGLAPTTTYYAWVRTVCGSDVTNWTPIVFRTPCAAYALPFEDDFNAGTTFSECWNRYSGDFDSVTPATTTTSGWSIQPSSTSTYVYVFPFEPNFLRINIYGTTKYWLVSPTIDLTEDAALSFDVALTAYSSSGSGTATSPYTYGAAQTSGADDRFVVAISTDGAPWTPLAQWGSDSSRDDYAYYSLTPTPTNISLPLSAYTGQQVRIAFFGGSTTSDADNYLWIDNLFVGSANCLRPSIASTSATDSSITLRWSDPSVVPAGYTLVLSPSDSVSDPAAITVASITDTTYTFTGLTANTVYHYFLRALCNPNAHWVTGTVRTECGPITTPYFTGFEGLTTDLTPDCWTSFPTRVGSTDYNRVRVSSSYTNSGSRALQFTYSNYNNLAILPATDVELNTLQLRFFLRANGTSSNYGTFAVGYVEDASDTTTFVPVETYSYSDAGISTYQEVEISMVDAPAGARAAMRHNGSGDYSWCIDDLNIEPITTCVRPSNPTISDVYYYGATFAWDDEEGTGNYELRFATVDDVNDTAAITVTGITDLTHIDSSLAPDTRYYAWVRANCGNEVSHWRPMGNFTTTRSCYPILNLTRTNTTTTAASFTWELDERGLAATEVIVTLLDLTDSTTVTEPATGATYHFFSGLQTGHNYKATFRTVCDPDSASAVEATFAPTPEACASVVGNVTHYDAPMRGNYNYGFCEMLYPASILSDVDTIKAISFSINNVPTSYLTRTVSLYLGHTTRSKVTIANHMAPDSLTLVLSSASMSVASTGWVTLTLTTPFVYDGTSNLIVGMHNNTGSFSGFYWDAMEVADTCTATWYSDASGFSMSTYATGGYNTITSKKLPNILFHGNCAVSSCTAPMAVISAVDTSSVTLTWMATGTETQWAVQYSTDGIAWTDGATATTTTATVENLLPATYYHFRIGALCGTDTAWSTTVSTFTGCAPVAVPFYESFDNALSPCWISAGPYISTTGGQSALYLNSLTNTIATPELDADLSTKQVRINASSSSTNYGIKVGVLDGTTLTWVDTLVGFAGSTSSFEERVVYLNNYTGSGNRVVFASYNTGTSTYAYAYINDLWIEDLDPCMPVNGLAVDGSSITESGATINWTAGGSETSWLVYLDGTLVGTASTPSYTFSGLAPSSAYLASVRAFCGGSDTARAVSITFRTPCGAIVALPWNEDFNAYPSNNVATDFDCWTILRGVGYVNPSTSYAVSGSAMRFYPNGSAAHILAVLPEFQAPVSTLEMQFASRPEGSSSGSISVGYITDPSDSTTFVEVQRFEKNHFYQPGSTTSFQFVTDTVQFAAAPAGARIAFRYNVTATNWYWFVDNIEVRTAAGAPDPTYYTVTLASADAAMGSVSPAGNTTVVENGSFTATATANAGYRFVAWTDAAGATVSTANPYTFTVTANTALTATFEATVTTVTVSVTADETMGSVLGAGTYESGAQVTLTATANTGYHFVAWMDGATQVSTANPYVFTATADVNLSAIFAADGTDPDQYTVTVNYDATRGTVTGAGTYLAGTSVTLVATSNPGYRFAGWSNGVADSNYTFTVTENVTLTANFAEVVGIQTPTSDLQPSIYPNPATTTVTLTCLEPGAQVTIVDLNGREISKFKIQNSEFEMDVTSLASGAYYVRITGQRQQAVRKLIVK